MKAANLHRKSFDTARPYYEQACRYAHDNDVMHYNYGLILGWESLLRDAADEFQKVLEIDRKNPKAKHYIEAFTVRYNQLSVKKKQDVPEENMYVRYKERAEKCFYTGDLDNALSNMKKALALYPDTVSELQNLATIYLLLGDYILAKKTFETVLRLMPDNTIAGKNLVSLKEFEAKLAVLKISDNIDQLNEETKRNYYDILIEQSVLEQQSGNPYNALFFLKYADEIIPATFIVYKQRGVLYLSLRQYISARKQLEQARRFDAEDVEVRQLISQIEQVLRQRSTSR